MKRIKLMPDYFCYPLWEVAPSIDGDISPQDLPISTELRDALSLMASTYDQTFNREDPLSSGFESQQEVNSFITTANALFTRLKAELGSDYEVIYGVRAPLKPL